MTETRTVPEARRQPDAVDAHRSGNRRIALVLAVVAALFFAAIIVNRVMHG